MIHFDVATKAGLALKRLVDEHGAPNSFGCGEVALYLNVTPMQVGAAMRNPRTYPLDVIRTKSELGDRLTYDGRFHVAAEKA